jgi:hypothetical protein
MALKYPRLADLNSKPIEPNYPVTLDTEHRPKGMDLVRVSDPQVADAIIKLHGLFTPYLVLNESQVLDHLGLRALFDSLRNNNQLREALGYLVDAGKDKLEMGPVILASERYSPKDPRHAFRLDKLLARKLGADDPSRHPWVLSSFWNEATRDQARDAILAAAPKKRLRLAMKLLEPGSGYASYIEVASEVWDRNADVTRVPLPAPDYAGRLIELLDQNAGSLTGRFGEMSANLRNAVIERSLRFKEGTKTNSINRSTVHRWLRERSAGDDLDRIATRAHPEAFVMAFPSHKGWNSTHDPASLGFLSRSGPSSRNVRRAPMSHALSEVAHGALDELTVDGTSPIIIANFNYKHLTTLRNNDEFQDSLFRLRALWGYSVESGSIKRAMHDHIKLIWGILRLKRKSSPFSLRGGPPVKVAVARHIPDLELGLTINEVAMNLGGANMFTIALGPLSVLVKNLYTLRASTKEWSAMEQISNRIVKAGFEPARKT